MSPITASELLPRLVGEYGYSARGADLVANKLVMAAPEVQEAFLHWWATCEFPEIQIEGHSLESLVAQHSMNPIAAFLTLDWLLRAPAEAKASLARGHDRVR